MRIDILAVGHRMPDWVSGGVEGYRKRMPPHIQVDVVELAPGHRSGRGSIEAAREKEAAALLKRAARSDVIIALDETGKAWNSTELADRMRAWLGDGANVALLVGGADGLTDQCRRQAGAVWSLSRLTLPHGLVRIVLAEQLYRAWTILQGHPYHRE